MKYQLRMEIVRSFVKKEFKQMFRDPRMRIILFVPPVVMLIMFGYAVVTDVKDVKMAVLDNDRTATSRRFVEKFTASGYFQMHSYLDTAKTADGMLDSGDIEMFIHIERGFARRLRSGRPTEVQILVDGTNSNRAALIVAYVNQITADFSYDYLLKKVRSVLLSGEPRMARFKHGVELKERTLFNPELSSRNYFIPGILGMIINMVAISMTAMSVVKEREIGTIEQIIVSPIQPMEYIAGKIIPYVGICFIDIIIISIAAIAWFGVPFNGSYLFLVFASSIFILANVSVGLFVSTISRSQQQAILSTFLYFLPSILFSGYIFPIYSMPEVIQYITYINPLRYYMTIVSGVFLKGVGVTVLWGDMLVLLIMGVFLFLLSAKRFNERLE